jgi:hypothetical protein
MALVLEPNTNTIFFSIELNSVQRPPISTSKQSHIDFELQRI